MCVGCAPTSIRARSRYKIFVFRSPRLYHKILHSVTAAGFRVISQTKLTAGSWNATKDDLWLGDSEVDRVMGPMIVLAAKSHKTEFEPTIGSPVRMAVDLLLRNWLRGQRSPWKSFRAQTPHRI